MIRLLHRFVAKAFLFCNNHHKKVGRFAKYVLRFGSLCDKISLKFIFGGFLI